MQSQNSKYYFGNPFVAANKIEYCQKETLITTGIRHIDQDFTSSRNGSIFI